MLVELVLTIMVPLGLDRYMPAPEDNPLTTDRIELGRQLFFDRRLSRDDSLSCASCHDPAHGFADGRSFAVGVDGRQGRRSSPALINRGYGRAFFWDARASSLEEQVVMPIEDQNELGTSLPDAAARVGVATAEIRRALASFVRSILSGNSPVDRFINGEREALTPTEQAGLQLFRGKANCVSCHAGPNLTDERLHNTGVAWRDQGLVDRGAGHGDFKTPTLREIPRTAPYMHDGSLATLEDVIEFYNGGGKPNPGLDPEIRPLRLTALEKQQIVAFLRALSGEVQYGTTPRQ